MGMGSIPCHGWTISQEHLQALLPEACDELQQALHRHSATLDELAQAIDGEEWVRDSEEAALELGEVLERLYQQFHVATTVEESFLELELFYYCDDLGSRYDDLEPGANWMVRGVRQFTPAGKQFQGLIALKSWTVYG